MIPTIARKRLCTRREADKITKNFLNLSHYRELLTRDARVVDPDTGEVVVMLVKQEIPYDIYEPAYEPLNTVNKLPSNRGTAVAGPGSMLPRITKDGKLSPRNDVSKELLAIAGDPRSDFVGFFDKKRCRETEWTLSNPEVFGPEVQALMRWVNARYQFHLPEYYAAQAVEVAKIPGRLIIPGTQFSTMTNNKNWQTAAHRDSGDLHAGRIALTALRSEIGGALIVPEYAIAVDFKRGDILFMDSRLLHGNGPFSGERLTQVYYVREKLHLCPQSVRQ